MFDPHQSDRRVGPDRESGFALVAGMISVLMLAGLAAALVTTNVMDSRSRRSSGARTRVEYVAEAGIRFAMADLAAGGEGSLGTENAPVPFGGGAYSTVARTDPDGSIRVESTARLDGTVARIEAVLAREGGSPFPRALFGDEGLTASGNIFVDSYRSDRGNYESQAVNYDSDVGAHFASADGRLGSNDDIRVSGSVTVFGDVQPGPGHSVKMSGRPWVSGSTAPAARAETLDPVNYAPPDDLAGGDDDGVGSGKNDLVLPSGTYRYAAIKLSGKTSLVVRGNVELYVDGNFQMSGKSTIIIERDASLTIHHGGGTLALSGQGTLNLTERPSAFRIFSRATGMHFSGNSDFCGAIYAPEADIQMSGNTNVCGAIVGKSIRVSGNADFHYDETLSNAGGGEGRLRLVSWRRL